MLNNCIWTLLNAIYKFSGCCSSNYSSVADKSSGMKSCGCGSRTVYSERRQLDCCLYVLHQLPVNEQEIPEMHASKILETHDNVQCTRRTPCRQLSLLIKVNCRMTAERNFTLATILFCNFMELQGHLFHYIISSRASGNIRYYSQQPAAQENTTFNSFEKCLHHSLAHIAVWLWIVC